MTAAEGILGLVVVALVVDNFLSWLRHRLFKRQLEMYEMSIRTQIRQLSFTMSDVRQNMVRDALKAGTLEELRDHLDCLDNQVQGPEEASDER